MTDREKLLKLILEADDICEATDCVYGDNCKYSKCTWCRHEMTADHLIANGVTIQRWIPVEERLPQEFVSVLGYMTDAGNFPTVRECYVVGRAFFFPALGDVHPVSHWMPIPEPPKEVE